jgi:hypothetical protein
MRHAPIAALIAAAGVSLSAQDYFPPVNNPTTQLLPSSSRSTASPPECATRVDQVDRVDRVDRVGRVQWATVKIRMCWRGSVSMTEAKW